MQTAKLSSKSQIVIPAEVRRRLNLRPGDVLQVDLEDERIIVTKQSPRSWVERLKEFADDDVWQGASVELERSRQEWEEYSRELERLGERGQE